MKVTPEHIDLFEKDQEAYGTKVALENFLWLLASDLLTDIGVRRVRTSYKEPTNA